MKPTFLLLPVLLLMPCAVAEDEDLVAEDPDEPVLSASEKEGELELAVQMTVDSLRSELAALHAMQDAESTAAATQQLYHALRIRYKVYGMSVDIEECREQSTEQGADLREACRQEVARLRENDFFGVIPVKALYVPEKSTVSTMGETLRAAPLLLHDDLEEMEELLREAGATYAESHSWIEGGPGTTLATAWRITAPTDVVPRERHFLRTALQMKPCGKSLHEVDGHFYDCLYLIITKDGEPYRLKQWFDVTPYYKVGGGIVNCHSLGR